MAESSFADYWVRLFSTHVNVQGQAYITTGEQSLIVSILSAGTFFGALSGAPIGDLAGRRLGLLGIHYDETRKHVVR